MGTVLVSCDTGTVLMSHTHVTGHKNRPYVRVTTLNDNLSVSVYIAHIIQHIRCYHILQIRDGVLVHIRYQR